MKPIFMETENHKKSWGGSRKKIQIKMRGKPLFYSLFEMLHFTLYTLHFTLYTLHFTLYTLHFTLYTLHFTLYTLPPLCSAFERKQKHHLPFLSFKHE